MKDLHLLVYSKNYALAETIKHILEQTGNFRIKIEKRFVENHQANLNYSNLLTFTEGFHSKISPIQKQVVFGDFVLDMNQRLLQWKNQKTMTLSHKESQILLELVENAGCVVSRSFLLFHYWGEISYYKSRCLDVVISGLRKYLHFDPSVKIMNVRNEGLRLTY